jgi:signal peptidase II
VNQQDSVEQSTRRIWLRPILIASTVIVLDQITKFWIWNTLGPVELTSRPLVGDWLKLTLVKNTGIAFGLFQSNAQFFTFTSVLISLGAIYFYRYHLPNQRLLVQICTGLIIGGAIGNIIDRIRLGFVIDFIHVTWFPGIFNIADSGITVGVLTLALYLMITGEDQPQQPKTVTDSQRNIERET